MAAGQNGLRQVIAHETCVRHQQHLLRKIAQQLPQQMPFGLAGMAVPPRPDQAGPQMNQ